MTATQAAMQRCIDALPVGGLRRAELERARDTDNPFMAKVASLDCVGPAWVLLRKELRALCPKWSKW